MQTSLGSADLDQVNVVGYDLNVELVGNVTFTDMVSLLLLQRWPQEMERRMLDAMLGTAPMRALAQHVYFHRRGASGMTLAEFEGWFARLPVASRPA